MDDIPAGTTADNGTTAGNDGGAIEGGAKGWPNAIISEAREVGTTYDTVDAGGVAVIGGREGTSRGGREIAGAVLTGGGG